VTTYEESGWCFVEASISSVLKASERRVNVSKYRPGRDETPYLLRLSNDGCLAGSRSAPLEPDRVASLLANEKKFYASSDIATVAGLYKTFFDAVVPAQRELVLCKLGWGDNDVVQLAEVLPCFCQLVAIDLSKNSIGAAGAKSVAAAMVVSASLTKIDLSSNRLGPAGAAALAPAVAASASLTVANVLSNNLDIESATLLVNAVKDKDVSLCGIQRDQTEADFRWKDLLPHDAVLLASDLSKAGVSASLRDLNLASNHLAGETGYVKATKVQGSSFHVGDKVLYEGREMVVSMGKDSDGDIKMIDMSGVKALADGLAVNAELTALDLCWNQLGREGKQVLEQAVKGRSGFDLKV